jgi:hypothetical protein
MAKKKKTKAGPGVRVWQADPDDAIRLAALRWFAIEIERLSIEIYASDKTRYLDLEDLLRGAVKRMKKITRRFDLDDEDCPNGYVLCKDGLCAPMCDGIITDNGT